MKLEINQSLCFGVVVWIALLHYLVLLETKPKNQSFTNKIYKTCNRGISLVI